VKVPSNQKALFTHKHNRLLGQYQRVGGTNMPHCWRAPDNSLCQTETTRQPARPTHT